MGSAFRVTFVPSASISSVSVAGRSPVTCTLSAIRTPHIPPTPFCRAAFLRPRWASQSAADRARSPQMRMGRGSNPPPAPVQERLLSILPYLIPLLDSLSFGRYVFAKIPLLGQVLLPPLYPLYNIYRGIPFFAFGVFLALFVLVVRNTNISRYIRFNTYQALVLDIALIFPQLFEGANRGGFLPSSVVEVFSTAVFYAISFAIIYAVVKNVKGEVPDEIPAVSDSVQQQLGPF